MGADRLDQGQLTPNRLVVRTVPVAGQADLLALLPSPDAVAWIRRGEGLIGWGETARISLPAGEDRFTAGEKWLRALFETAEVDDRVGLAGCGPVAFGSFTFDPASDGSLLVVPRTVIGRSGGRTWHTTIGDGRTSGDGSISGDGRHQLGRPGAASSGPGARTAGRRAGRAGRAGQRAG